MRNECFSGKVCWTIEMISKNLFPNGENIKQSHRKMNHPNQRLFHVYRYLKVRCFGIEQCLKMAWLMNYREEISIQLFHWIRRNILGWNLDKDAHKKSISARKVQWKYSTDIDKIYNQQIRLHKHIWNGTCGGEFCSAISMCLIERFHYQTWMKIMTWKINKSN